MLFRKMSLKNVVSHSKHFLLEILLCFLLIQPPSQWVPGVIFPGVKWPGREAGHSPPSSAEVKNAWSYTSIPPYVFTARCNVKNCTVLSFHLTLTTTASNWSHTVQQTFIHFNISISVLNVLNLTSTCLWIKLPKVCLPQGDRLIVSDYH
jgi:hypothetical protein